MCDAVSRSNRTRDDDIWYATQLSFLLPRPESVHDIAIARLPPSVIVVSDPGHAVLSAIQQPAAGASVKCFILYFIVESLQYDFLIAAIFFCSRCVSFDARLGLMLCHYYDLNFDS